MFLRASGIFQQRKIVRSLVHRASIELDANIRVLDRNVHSLCMHLRVTLEYKTYIIRRRWTVLFPNLLESGQSLSRTRLAGHLPIRAKPRPSLDSAQTHALRKVRSRRRPGLRQQQPHRETDARGDLALVPLLG